MLNSGTRLTARVAAAALAAATMWGAAAAPATAWPIPLTDVEVNYLNSVRGAFPGNDDQLLLAGKQACRMLYTGQGTLTTTNATATQYGVSFEQAANLVGAARSTMCTQAPG
jgi:hypothetical protein